MPTVNVEACVAADHPLLTERSVRNAYAGGADTIELCRDLLCGGLTPDPKLVHIARQAFGKRPGMMVMIRPRPGDFNYEPSELALMEAQIDAAARAGADGVVFGVVRAQSVDLDAVKGLVLAASARGLRTTFHRAFDTVTNRVEALDSLIQAGVHRVLTSGTRWEGGQPATEGIDILNELLLAAEGRIEIVIGGGVGPGNVDALLRTIRRGITPFGVHAYSSLLVEGITDAAKVADFVARVKHASQPGVAASA